jgi:hypothetical protein
MRVRMVLIVGVVVITSANGTEDRGFESPQGLGF